MTDANIETGAAYQPKILEVPPLYTWPPRPLAALRYLLWGMMFPWGYVFVALAFPTWWYLTPSLETMATFEPGWIALLWLRNCALLCLFAGSLHWLQHRRRAQGRQYRMNRKDLATDGKLFLWRNQVRDNIFWSIVSGVSFWTAYEAVTYWFYASGRLPVIDNPWYLIACVFLVILWSTAHFYFVHRWMHWPAVYPHVHELHHRNVDIGPWTGISMHPFEHLFYFSLFMLWWIVPVHPVIIVMTGFYQGISPCISHSGFDYLRLGPLRVKTGDWFHQLHHQYFNLNYGNTPTPLDKVFGSWHDGSPESLAVQKARIRERRRAAN